MVSAKNLGVIFLIYNLCMTSKYIFSGIVSKILRLNLLNYSFDYVYHCLLNNLFGYFMWISF